MRVPLFPILGGAALLVVGWTVGRGLAGHYRWPEAAPLEAVAETEIESSSGIDLRDRVESASTAELGALFFELSEMPHHSLDSLEAFRLVIRRCILENPKVLTEDEVTLSGGDPRLLRQIAREWLETDAAGYFAMAASRDASTQGQLYYMAAIRVPETLLDRVAVSGSLPENLMAILATAVAEIARSDPREAARRMETLGLAEGLTTHSPVVGTDRSSRDLTLPTVIAGRLSEENPEEALAWAKSLRTPEGRKEATTVALVQWALASPDEAAAAFASISAASGISSRELIYEIGKRDPDAAILWAERHGDSDASYTILVSRLRGSEALLRVCERFTDATQRERFRSTALAVWDQRPAVDGLALAMSAPPDSREKAIASLANGLARADLDAAVTFAEKIDDPRLRAAYEKALQPRIRDADPVRAIAMAEESGDEQAFLRTLEDVAYNHSMRSDFSPKEVYEWTLRSDGLLLRGDIYQELGSRYYRENPKEALAWLDTLESGDAKNFVVGGMISSLADRDPDAAVAWIESQNRPSDRENAVRTVAKRLSYLDPPRAFSLYRQIPDPDMASLTRMIRTWAKRDPAAARAAVAGLNVPETERARLESWIYAPR